MSQIYWRVCITILMPQWMRTQPGFEGAVHSQVPISDWLDMCQGYDLICSLREALPITTMGCLYDFLQMDVDGHEEHRRRMAALKLDGTKYIEAAHVEKMRIISEAKKNARDFIRDFDAAAYFALHIAGREASR